MSQQKTTHEFIDPMLAMQALDNANDGITISDMNLPDQPLIFVNKAFEQMTGYTSAEVIGKNCRFLQGDVHDAQALEVIREAIKSQTACRVVIKNFTKQGTPFWNELSLAPIQNGEKKTRYYVGVQKNITSEIMQKEKIIYLAQHDDLTGLYNYRGFFNHAHELLEKANSLNLNIGIGVVDIDYFKHINDTKGHLYGNNILKMLSNEFLSQFSKEDVISRLGGDEFFFTVILQDNQPDWFYRKIRESVQNVNSVLAGSQRISVSAGFHAELARDTSQLDDLIRKADNIMYQNKKKHHTNKEK